MIVITGTGLEILLIIVCIIVLPIIFGIWTIAIIFKRGKVEELFTELSASIATYWIYYILVLIGYLIYGGICWW